VHLVRGPIIRIWIRPLICRNTWVANISCLFRVPLFQDLARKAYSYLSSGRTEISSLTYRALWRAHPWKGDTAKDKVDYRDFLALCVRAKPGVIK
jgi:hypothetical protein